MFGQLGELLMMWRFFFNVEANAFTSKRPTSWKNPRFSPYSAYLCLFYTDTLIMKKLWITISFYFISSHFINSIPIIRMISTIPGAWQSYAHETKVTKMPLRNFQMAHTSPGTAWRVVKAPHRWDFVYILLYWKMSLFHGSWINDLQTIMPSVSLFPDKISWQILNLSDNNKTPAWPADLTLVGPKHLCSAWRGWLRKPWRWRATWGRW